MFVFAWKNVDSFRRHMEAMESFRRAHEHLPPAKPAVPTKKAPTPSDSNPDYTVPPVNVFAYVNGKKIIVPIWYISMPKGSEN